MACWRAATSTAWPALGPRCDFARDIALYYPLQVIMHIFGVPESDEARMLQLTQQLFGNEDPEFAGEDRTAALLATALDFKQYFDALTENRRANPADDIASVLANATSASARTSPGWSYGRSCASCCRASSRSSPTASRSTRSRPSSAA